MKRTAILSDIHGNSIALEAVLKDIQEAGGVDAYYVLGDLAAVGHDPLRSLELLKNLSNAQFVQGNTDRFLLTGVWPIPPTEDMLKEPEYIPAYINVAAGMAWTQGALTLSGWMPWLADLPLELRTTLPDGTRFLGVHAAPGSDEGSGINPTISQDDLSEMVKRANADLICVGHTHWPLELHVDSVHIFNIGSVSNPMIPELKACYALLEAGKDGYQIQHRYVDYDHEAVIQAIKQLNHPMGEYISDYQLGKIKPSWLRSKE